MAVAIITAAVATLVRQQAQESRPPNSAQRYPQQRFRTRETLMNRRTRSRPAGICY